MRYGDTIRPLAVNEYVYMDAFELVHPWVLIEFGFGTVYVV